MQRKFFLLISSLVLVFSLLLQGNIAYATGVKKTENLNENLSYYFIHYSGGKQEIVINENVTLVLSGWIDETHSSVYGNITFHNELSSQPVETKLTVNNQLNELTLHGEESIFYRVEESDTFRVEEVQPLKINEKTQVISKNDNGTSKVEVEIIDDYGTVIEEKGLNYYLTDDKNEKTLITKAEYDSLNTDKSIN